MNEENIERAWEEIDKGKIKDGIYILNDVLLQSPNDWKVYYNLGQAYKIDGNIDKAIELLDKAKTLDNEGYLCNYFGLTEVYMMKIDFENAIVSLRNVFSSSDPKTINILQIIHSIGLDFFKNNQINFAKEVFEKANEILYSVFFTELRMSREYPDNYILRTVGNESELDWDKINIEFDVFLKTNSLCCQIKNNLGVCRAELGDLQGAIEAFNESIKFTPAGLDYQAPIIALKEIEDMRKEDSEIFNRLGYSEDEIQESGKIIITESGRKIIMNKRKNE
jgi:tetratricopeptide (TPR) repeat protein|tara:strand:- start:151 stop:987 length:837 start_codon:yes stop_codon:yes gene_type:complete